MYFLIVIVLAFLAIFCETKFRFKSSFVSFLTLFLFIIFIGLRYGVGTDWELLFSNFTRLTLGEDIGWSVSPLYSLISLISHYAGLSIYGLNVACASLFCIGLFSLLSRLSRPWLSLCVFYPYYILVFSFNFDRQSAALGFVMLAINYLLDSHKFRFIFFLLLGSLFHPSSLVLLPLLFTTDSITRKSYLIFVTSTCVLLWLCLPLYLGFISKNITSLFYNYFAAGYVYESQGLWLRLIPLLLSVVLFAALRRRYTLTKFQLNIYSFMALMVILLSVSAILLPSVSTVIDRISAYASPLLIFAVSESPKLMKINGIPSSFVVTFFALYSVFQTALWLRFSIYASTYWIPYQNILIN